MNKKEILFITKRNISRGFTRMNDVTRLKLSRVERSPRARVLDSCKRTVRGYISRVAYDSVVEDKGASGLVCMLDRVFLSPFFFFFVFSFSFHFPFHRDRWIAKAGLRISSAGGCKNEVCVHYVYYTCEWTKNSTIPSIWNRTIARRNTVVPWRSGRYFIFLCGLENFLFFLFESPSGDK